MHILLTILLVWGIPSQVVSQDLSAYVAARHVSSSPGQRRIATSLRAAAQMVAQYGTSMASTMVARTLRLSPDGVLEVYMHLDRLTSVEHQILQQHGVRVLQTDIQFGMMHASVAIDTLDTIATLPFVRWISPPSLSVLRTGSVTSAGDAVLRAAEARNTFGVDGSGVRVGIVSDSLINLQDSVASGDLPSDVIIVNGQDGSGIANPTDEGRALAEIIHDLAPGATLLFHSGFPTSFNMIRAIQALTDAGADIIIDDIGFFDEPVFEDGLVAQAVQNAIDDGVVYITAIGNDADRHYKGMYVDADRNDPVVNLHDFDETEATDTTLDVEIDAGDTMIAVLQWPNRFDGSGTDNYDLLIFDATGSTALFDADSGACTISGFSGTCASMNDQTNAPAPPLESVLVTNTSDEPITVTVVIDRVAGAPLLLTIHFNRDARLQEHMVANGSAFGHPCVREALAVGAISVSDPGFDTIEPFSSHGPCEIFSPVPEDRTKPDLVATDGVFVSPSLPRFRPFFGTSAAVPHVAAIAALLIDAAGGPGVLSNTQIADTLRQAADDRGAPGPDNIFGFGAVDAVDAVGAVLTQFANLINQAQSDSGGGCGCSIAPGELPAGSAFLAALGNIFLPLVVLVVIRTWHRYRSRY